VSYLRVSMVKQGRSGLGLEAQRAAIADYLNGGQWKHVAEFVEVESGKRNDDKRPRLHELFRSLSPYDSRGISGKKLLQGEKDMKTAVVILVMFAAVALGACRREAPEYVPMKLGAELPAVSHAAR